MSSPTANTTRLSAGWSDWVGEFFDELSRDRLEKLLEFIEYLELQRDSRGTIENYIKAVKKLGTDGKPYEELTRRDLIKWMHKLPDSRRNGDKKLSDEYLNSIRGHVKRFLKWVHNEEGKDTPLEKMDVPEQVQCIKIKRSNKHLPKNILSRKEVKKLISAASTHSQRDRALVFVGYESGCRASELLGLRIEDVQVDQYGATILVDGKTGERRIRLIESAPDLQLWVNLHPHADEPKAPLWLSREGHKKGLTIRGLQERLKLYSKKAELRKHVHPHLLRHSRATELATVLTDAQMREFFGWSKSSDTPSKYTHLSGRDVDSTLLNHYGIKDEEKERGDQALKPRKCPRCGRENPADARFCYTCSHALDLKASMELVNSREMSEALIVSALSDPEFRKEFERKIIREAKAIISKPWDYSKETACIKATKQLAGVTARGGASHSSE